MHGKTIACLRAIVDEALAIETALSSNQALFAGAAAFVVIGISDWLTTYELSLNPFYLVVVIFITWRSGWHWGIAFAVASISNQVGIGLVTGHPFSKSAYFAVANFNKLFSALVVIALLARLKVVHEREKNHARFDFLTGALNYKGFNESLKHELARQRRVGQSFSVAYLDCDDFKGMNDRFGHQAGDQLLIEVVRALRNHLRETDAVARLGGDEFAILLPDTDARNVRAIIDRLHADLAAAFGLGRHPVTLSIGVATFQAAPQSEQDVLAVADRLMYQAKARGKNSVIYETSSVA
jgi:diguanylate cyclase (GGDEF)-like protein